mmetsp:Transcript_20861/g.31456  ORF Transcript_20861/g.31456 Transcript_20861/m.31456 type:complete len:133 (-) Transcript_20861:51-449(-)
MFQICLWPGDNYYNTNDDYLWQMDIPHFLSSSADTSSFSKNNKNTTTSGQILAPMPGCLRRLHVAAVGDVVEEGEVVAVLEAMKMEHAIVATCGGKVTKLPFQETDIVQEGDLLVLIAAEEEEEKEEKEQAV